MPIFGITPAIGAAIGTVLTGFGSFLASGTFLAGVTKSAIALGLQLAVQTALPTVGADAAVVQGAELQITFGEDQPRIVRCGRFGVRGHFIYANGSGEANKNHDQVFVLSHYYTTALDEVRIDGEAVSLGPAEGDLGQPVTSGKYTGLIWVRFYDGRQTTADPVLVADANPTGRWSADHVGVGVSYVRVRFRFDREDQTRPADMFFAGRGAPLYDRAKDSTVGGVGAHRWGDVSTHEFDERPILAAYNYARGFSVNGDLFCGMGLPASVLPLGRWLVANAICGEATVYGQRYRAALGFNATAIHRTNLKAAMGACGGVMVEEIDGLWPLVGAAQPVVATITDDALVENASWEYNRHRPLDERIRAISGTYPEPDNQWSATSYPTVDDPAAPAIDQSGRAITLDFSNVPYRGQVEQLVAMAKSENAFEATATVTLTPEWGWLKTGDWVELAIEGRQARVMRLVARERASLHSAGPRNVTVSLEERSAAIYTSVGVTLPPVAPAPGTPVYQQELAGFDVDPAFSIGDQGAVQAAMLARWLPPTDPTVTGVLLQWRRTADPERIFEMPVSRDVTVRLLTEGVVGLTEYQVRHVLVTDPARPVSPSAWVDVTTDESPAGDITVQLQNLGDDAYGALQDLRADMDRFFNRQELLAGNVAIDAADEFVRREIVEKRTENTRARIIQEAQVSADEDNALGQLITAVEALAGDATAQALFKITAQAGSGDVVVRFSLQLRASQGDAYKDSGMFLDIVTDGGDPPTFTARAMFAVDQFIVFDPDSGSQAKPLSFENGGLTAAFARFKESVTELSRSPNNKLRWGELAPGIDGVEIST